jgi:succinate-semialdehyde dehydrogenase/glutarate-semialdehyde dehydrogenase
LLFIDGAWRSGGDGRSQPVINPASDAEIGTVAHATRQDLDAALDAAGRALPLWRDAHAYRRSEIMRGAAQLLRERAPEISRAMTMEQGKPLAEALGETLAAAGTIEWFAEEGRRAYGRIVPARSPGVMQ